MQFAVIYSRDPCSHVISAKAPSGVFNLTFRDPISANLIIINIAALSLAKRYVFHGSSVFNFLPLSSIIFPPVFFTAGRLTILDSGEL